MQTDRKGYNFINSKRLEEDSHECITKTLDLLAKDLVEARKFLSFFCLSQERRKGGGYPDLSEDTFLLEGSSDQCLEIHHLSRVIVHFETRGCFRQKSFTFQV